MNRSRLSFFAGITAALTLGAVLAFVPTAFAQTGAEAQSGLAAFGEAAGFSAAPLPLVIARLIRTVIGFLGIVIVSYVLYGGFLYMTAGGDATRVDAAKRVLRNAIIGFVLVISSFAIASFVITRVSDAVGGAGTIGGGGDTEGGCPGCIDGQVNGRRNFAMSSWNQQCGGLVRNAQLQWVFTQSVSATSVTNAQRPGIEVKGPAGAAVGGTFAARGNTVTFTPDADCPAPATGEKCLAADTTYAITFNPTVLRSATGAQFQCGGLFAPCTLSFTTGSAIDAVRPTVDMTQPTLTGASAAIGDIVPLQVRVRDDVGGSLAQFFADDASKPVFTAGVPQSTVGTIAPDNAFSTDATAWNTAAYAAGSYDVWAVGADCAGHEATAVKVKVALVSAQCTNGVQDGSETALDCGGSCGACAGGACRITTDCATGFTCRAGVCLSTPRIDRVTANDGAPGNLITLSGDGFGTDAGTVVFLGDPAVATDDVSAAPAAMCGPDAWNNRQVVVQIPLGAESGPLELRTAAFSADKTKADRTNDTFGPRVSDFTVNEVVRPGLCSITPAVGVGGIGAVLSGINFGPARQEGTVYFGNYVAAAYGAWAPAAASVTVPRLDASTYPVQLVVGSKVCQGTTTACTDDTSCTGVPCISNRQGSNPVSFAVQSISTQTPPRISGVDTGWKACNAGSQNGNRCTTDTDCGSGQCVATPTWGPLNQYVTITGTNFGSAGLIRFRDAATGKSAVGAVNFPEACGSAFWTDTATVVKVPSTFSDGTPVTPGAFTIIVDRGGVVSESADFQVVAGSAGPGLCRLDPMSGPVGTTVTAIGENFAGETRFVFRDNKPTSPAEADGAGRLLATVPTGAISGAMSVERTAPDRVVSNSVNFSVGSCRDGAVACAAGTQCCADGTCSLSCGAVAVDAHYAYLFSTGPIPAAPRVRVACNADEPAASPSPWDGWSKAGTVCSNAVVTAEFDRAVDRAFMRAEHVRVQACTGSAENRCGTLAAPLAGALLSTTDQSFAWQKADRSPLDAGTTYQVTLEAAGFRSASRLSADNVQLGLEPMEDDYSWRFSTAATGAPCTIGGLMVQPDVFTATTPDQVVAYTASPLAKEDRCVVLACADDMRVSWNVGHPNEISLADDTTTPGACDQLATVRLAIPDNNGQTSVQAQLTNISGTPKDEALLTVDFEDPKVLESWPSCETACLNSEIGARFNVVMESGDFTTSTVELFACDNAVCAPSARAKVSVGVTYTNVNASTLVLSPSTALLPDTYYQIRIAGSVRALRSGARLADSYAGGDFTSIFRTDRTGQACGIDRVAVEPKEFVAKRVGDRATFTATPFGVPDACSPSGQRLNPMSYEWNAWTAVDAPDRVASPVRVAYLLPPGAGEGAIQLYAARELPASCTSQCLNAGAQAMAGEALCGNGTKEVGEDCDGGASCTASCLRAPVAACAPGVTTNCCGNGFTEGNEECDVGAAGGSTCTASCLNAGSTVYCGNGKVETEAGEECDDRNRLNNDGCSSVCLNEGTKSRTSVVAICGNSRVETGEDCDDANATDGDGCSARCLAEGSTGGAVCGDGQVSRGTVGSATGPRGEDCDDGNSVFGDGCSSRCLKEGSSIRYAIPSFCGNSGMLETGEECEVVSPTSAPKLQPFGVTQIDVTAPQEVDPVTKLATSTVSAQESSSRKVGTAKVSLECACSTDNSCGGSGFACGSGSCCLPRPTFVDARPVTGLSGVCRNADIWASFSKPMDEGSLKKNLFLELPGLTSVACTTAGGTFSSPTAFVPPTDLVGRAWNFVRSLVITDTAQAQGAGSAAYCLVPVTQTVVGNTVYVRSQAALAANTAYRLVAIGDDNVNDGVKVGLLSADQVTLDPRGLARGAGLPVHMAVLTAFVSGTDICAIDRVQAADLGKLNATGAVVAPPEDKSLGFVSASGERHAVTAATLSKDGQELVSRAPYTWSLTWRSTIPDTGVGADKNVVSTTGTPLAPTVTAGTVNGSETVTAEAKVTTSVPSLPVVGTVTLGKIEFEALLCSNPSAIGRPYVQAETNFGFTYCRDAGDPKKLDDDLPELTVAQVPNSPVGAFREFLYKLAGTQDGLGVRVINNDEYLTPMAWYAKQGFKGSPSPTKVDGYEAVQDGNTWYVFAPNVVNGKLYPNIYVISYNPDARAGSQEAFTRILSTWRFNTNQATVTNYNLCRISSSGEYLKNAQGSYASCTWDGDCLDRCIGGKTCSVSGAPCATDAACPYAALNTLFCDAEKAKIRRDTKRLQDVVVMKAALDQLGDSSRHCSTTKTQRCSTDAQCVNGERCVDDVPTLAEGTFLRTLAVSTWPSWSAALGNAVGTALPADPINEFFGCEEEGYDRETCFNSAASKFVCPAQSQVYAFQSVGGESYTLSARLEYAGASWNKPIDLNANDNATIQVDNAKDLGATPGSGFTVGGGFCAGTVLGTSSTCGDGIKAVGEVCELGEVKADTATCNNAGYRNVACVKQASGACGWQTDAQAGACVSYRCGNGTKETGEDCDDGARNGTYGSRCNAECKSYSATNATGFSFCGDGFLSGGEQCDCGMADNFVPLLNAYQTPLLGNWAKANACGKPNGTYWGTLAQSCSLDCRKPGPSCGDGVVQTANGETCEGTQEETATGVCGATTQGCSTNAQCPAGIACVPFVNSKVCEKGLASHIGSVCVTNTDCDTTAAAKDGRCSVATYPLITSRVCLAPGVANQCTFGPAATGWSAPYAKGQPACGNGKKEGAEACDDGNLKDDDACTSECKVAMCGDGKVQAGVESCDYGAQNGVACTPSYGATCNYCTPQCQRKTVSGAFCGDGVVNGNEFCDGTQHPFACVRANGVEPITPYTTQGFCQPADSGKIGGFYYNGQDRSRQPFTGSTQFTGCAADTICLNVGICNGGPINGLGCAATADCGVGGSCVFPSCTASCSSACPFGLETVSLKMQPEGSNVTNATSVDLYAAGSGTPDGGFLTMPACSVATQFFADVDDTKVIYPKIDIVFVTDISGSMSSSAGEGKTRMEVAKQSLNAAIDELFDSYTKARLRISLVSFGTTCTYSDDPAQNSALDKPLTDVSGRQELKNVVAGYAPDGCTPTYAGVRLGIDQLAASDPGTEKFVFLVSDGEPNGREAEVARVTDLMRETRYSDIQFYSSAITDTANLIGWMAHMSSDRCGRNWSVRNGPADATGGCEPANNIEYAYDGGTAAEIRTMYSSIIDSILGVTVRYLTGTNDTLRNSAGTIRSGKGISLPFPDGFVCSPTVGNQNVRFSVAFNAQGTVNFSNFKMTYCPAR